MEETAHETILLPPYSENLDFLSNKNLPVDDSRSNSEKSSESYSVTLYSFGFYPSLSRLPILYSACSITVYDSLLLYSEDHFHIKRVPFELTEKILLLSEEKNAEAIGFLFPENVKGRKFGSLCSEINLSVRSSLQVKMNLESLDQVTPVIF